MKNPGHYLHHLQSCIHLSTADCVSVLELGCGLGDKLAFCGREKNLTGIDPHLPYIKRARARYGYGMSFIQENMLNYCSYCVSNFVYYDAVLMIDTIEHVEKKVGTDVVKLAKQIARQRIIVFTPDGYMPQDEEAMSKSWVGELGGQEYQEHKSGWNSTELTNLGFDVALWKEKHDGHGALFAIWNQL